MQIKLTQPVEGHDTNETITVDAGKGDWYVQNGYATEVGGSPDDEFGKFATSAPAADDPTLAENREDTTSDVPGVHTKTVSDDPADPTDQAAQQDRSGQASGVNPEASLSTPRYEPEPPPEEPAP